jgi:flavodoxin
MILLHLQEGQDMYQVLFDSRGGNTRKLADAIAGELGVKATSVKGASLNPESDLIFLGSGCYGSKPGQDMVRFIETTDLSGRQVALFGTSGGGIGNEVKAMEEALKSKGARVRGSYYCKGKFLLWSRGHPDQADLDAARKFAREMVKNG